MNPRTLILIVASLALILYAAAAQRETAPKPPTITTRADLAKTIAELQADQNALDSSHRAYVANAEKLLRQYALLAKRAEEVTKTAADVKGGKADSAPLRSAIQRMHETQMSFNLQYLQLQSAMQHENRSYTAISNIMKTKHDTVKNSIGNIR